MVDAQQNAETHTQHEREQQVVLPVGHLGDTDEKQISRKKKAFMFHALYEHGENALDVSELVWYTISEKSVFLHPNLVN